jgi:Fur family ferric uptake transcriptional regulator
MKKTPFLQKLKESGERITPAREAIVTLMEKQAKPLSVDLVLGLLAKKNILVNKTTVYREMDFLLARGVVRTVHLDDCCNYYELVEGHHHHVICSNCRSFIDVDTATLEEYLHKLEKKLIKKIQFNSLRHSLEFFGICGKCANKSYV